MERAGQRAAVMGSYNTDSTNFLQNDTPLTERYTGLHRNDSNKRHSTKNEAENHFKDLNTSASRQHYDESLGQLEALDLLYRHGNVHDSPPILPTPTIKQPARYAGKLHTNNALDARGLTAEHKKHGDHIVTRYGNYLINNPLKPRRLSENLKI